MCGAFEGEKEEDTEEAKDPYIPKPFPNDKFILDAWMDTLATIDVCVNEATPIVFVVRRGMTWCHSKWSQSFINPWST